MFDFIGPLWSMYKSWSHGGGAMFGVNALVNDRGDVKRALKPGIDVWGWVVADVYGEVTLGFCVPKSQAKRAFYQMQSRGLAINSVPPGVNGRPEPRGILEKFMDWFTF